MSTFAHGDLVRVSTDLPRTKALQAGHGGWADCMAGTLGKVGRVVRVFSDGDIRVRFAGGDGFSYNPASLLSLAAERGRGGGGVRWNAGDRARVLGMVGDVVGVTAEGKVNVRIGGATYACGPSALSKLVGPGGVHVGDSVRICSDRMLVESLQKGHGEWSDGMAACLGKIGDVRGVDANGDLMVKVPSVATVYKYNRLAVNKVGPAYVDDYDRDLLVVLASALHFLERE